MRPKVKILLISWSGDHGTTKPYLANLADCNSSIIPHAHKLFNQAYNEGIILLGMIKNVLFL